MCLGTSIPVRETRLSIIACCIWSVIQPQSSISISCVSFQRNLAKETYRTRSTIEIWEWRNDTPIAIGCMSNPEQSLINTLKLKKRIQRETHDWFNDMSQNDMIQKYENEKDLDVFQWGHATQEDFVWITCVSHAGTNSQYKFSLRFLFKLEDYWEIWVFWSGGFRGCSIFSEICHTKDSDDIRLEEIMSHMCVCVCVCVYVCMCVCVCIFVYDRLNWTFYTPEIHPNLQIPN